MKSIVEQKKDLRQVCPVAVTGFGISVIAVVLAFVGTFGPAPFGAVRIPVVQLSGFQAILVYGGTFLLPLLLGVAGAYTGSYAFTTIERSEGRLKGHSGAVFAVLLGLFSVVLAGSATYAVLIAPMFV
jgi:hypothetical protein